LKDDIRSRESHDPICVLEVIVFNCIVASHYHFWILHAFLLRNNIYNDGIDNNKYFSSKK